MDGGRKQATGAGKLANGAAKVGIAIEGGTTTRDTPALGGGGTIYLEESNQELVLVTTRQYISMLKLLYI